VWAITLTEIVAGLLLIAGRQIRIAAGALLVIAVGGILLIHRHFGWFVGEHGTGGSEYSAALIVLLLILIADDQDNRSNAAASVTRRSSAVASLIACAAMIGLIAPVRPAAAQAINEEKSICLDRYKTEPAERVILACTSVIAFRTLDDAERPVAFLRRAEARQNNRQETLALADYNSAIALAPDMADAYFGRGVIYMGISSPRERALADFDEAIRLDPRHDRAFNNRSLVQLSDDKALADISEAIRIAPRASYFGNRAHILTRLANHEGALSDYNRAIKLAPADALYRSNRADTLMELGEVKKAIADYTAAIARAPKVPRNHSSRAAAYERVGERKKAIVDVRAALSLFPDDWKARELLCKLVPVAERTPDEQGKCPIGSVINP
jgi:tetratricopeptide (TPR) repeat protein